MRWCKARPSPCSSPKTHRVQRKRSRRVDEAQHAPTGTAGECAWARQTYSSRPSGRKRKRMRGPATEGRRQHSAPLSQLQPSFRGLDYRNQPSSSPSHSHCPGATLLVASGFSPRQAASSQTQEESRKSATIDGQSPLHRASSPPHHAMQISAARQKERRRDTAVSAK